MQTSTTYVDNLEIPFITQSSVRAVKEWLFRMQRQQVLIDFTHQKASDFHPANTSDCEIDPAVEFTFDQCGFIDGQLALAKSICEKSGYRFNRALGYLPVSDSFYLEVYPMINTKKGSTLCTREHQREPEFYDVALRNENLNAIPYELENIPLRHINRVVHAVCNRFGCDYESVCG